MLKGFMYSTLVADPNDVALPGNPKPQWQMKLDALKDRCIEVVSVVMMIVRPKFPTIYPYLTADGREDGNYKDRYDLTKFNLRYWNFLEEVINYCRKIGMMIQLDLFNEPTARHLKALPCYSNNTYGKSPKFPDALRERPTDLWADAVAAFVQKTVPYLNKAAAPHPTITNWKAGCMYLLEGTNSMQFEKYCHEIALAAGLNTERVAIISNSVKAPGVVYSVHVHSMDAVRKYAKKGAYLSDDGKYDADEKFMKDYAQTAYSRGCVAAEMFTNGLPTGHFPLNANGERKGSGNTPVPYEDRVRPTLAQWGGEIRRLVEAFCRATPPTPPPPPPVENPKLLDRINACLQDEVGSKLTMDDVRRALEIFNAVVQAPLSIQRRIAILMRITEIPKKWDVGPVLIKRLVNLGAITSIDKLYKVQYIGIFFLTRLLWQLSKVKDVKMFIKDS